MMNYIVWRCDSENEILIEVFNSSDVLSIQKDFLERGYIIEEYWDTCKSSFIRAYKREN